MKSRPAIFVGATGGVRVVVFSNAIIKLRTGVSAAAEMPLDASLRAIYDVEDAPAVRAKEDPTKTLLERIRPRRESKGARELGPDE